MKNIFNFFFFLSNNERCPLKTLYLIYKTISKTTLFLHLKRTKINKLKLGCLLNHSIPESFQIDFKILHLFLIILEKHRIIHPSSPLVAVSPLKTSQNPRFTTNEFEKFPNQVFARQYKQSGLSGLNFFKKRLNVKKTQFKQKI